MNSRLSGHWFYEVAHCDCTCQIITAGRTQLQRGEKLYCEKCKRVVKVAYASAATLAQQDALCWVDEPDSESSANIIANEPVALANG